MKINSKFILSFLLISLIPIALIALISILSFQKGIKNVIGTRLGALAREEAGVISLLIKEKIKDTEILAETSDVKEAVLESNAAYINRSEDEIKDTIIQIDKEWIESKGATKTADQILNNSLSVFLKTLQRKYDAEYGDIFVTDREGATVAMTKTLTDYYQSDEKWWQNTHNQGRGSVFIDDRGYDISINALVLGVSVPIKEGEEVIGVLKISYKVEDILDIVVNIKTEENAVSSLVRSQGDTLAHSSKELGMEQITDAERNLLAKKEYGWIDNIHGNQRTIMGYSSIDADIYTRVSSPGARKGISGEKWEPTKWYLFLDKKQSEAFEPIYKLRNIIITTTTIITLIVIVIALRISKTISKPIHLLQEGVKVIGSGNLDYKVGINTKDEIGQLSKAFNQMTEDLQTTTTSIEDLNKEINERKQAEEKIKELNESLERRVIERTEELRESEMKYSILAQTSPVGMWHTDANGDCLYINERCSEIIGLSVEDALQDGWAQNLHPDDHDRVFKEWYDTAKNKQVFKSEYRFALPNGKTTWVYGQATPEIDKNGFVVGYVGTITDITERKKFEDQIKSSLKEKEVLIKEVQHRVKNNMQLITSLLRLQSERIEDKHLHDIFLESQNRVKSMALIHEELYASKDLTSIEFYHIVRSLINSVMRSYEIDPNRVAVNMIGNEVLLDVNKAIPCGLIINELVSNSLKYAFPEDKKGELKVTMCRISDIGLQNADLKSKIQNPKSKMELIISDNGVGLPEDMDFKTTKTLGLYLVNTLTDQIDGTIELDRNKGTEFKITFEADG